MNDEFLKKLFDYYHEHQRNLPWRKTSDPYKIMVSEIMLQQTQVNRVIPKYEAFLQKFPSINELSTAPLAEVLILWSGLGYNRRAKFLHQAAHKVTTEFNGTMPKTVDELMHLPGIGKNTAGAIVAYAYNQPVAYVETNIRSVILHHFFTDEQGVSDAKIENVLRQLITKIDSPRDFYWAMMDYGTHLKTTDNNIKRSKHYAKQSIFKGSKRQVRGQVIKLLVEGSQTVASLQRTIDDERLPAVLDDLVNERLIVHNNNHYSLG